MVISSLKIMGLAMIYENSLKKGCPIMLAMLMKMKLRMQTSRVTIALLKKFL